MASLLSLAFYLAVTTPAFPAHATSMAEPVTAQVPPAPVVNFAGRAVERGTRQPIADAEISIPGTGQVEFTGRDGRFMFREVPTGSHAVKLMAAGYKRFKTTESIAANERTDAIYYLVPDDTAVDEVVVEADVSKKEVSKTTLKREEIRKVPGTNGDAVKVVTVLPGVALSNELDSNLLVRGSGADENNIEIDRVNVPYLFHVGGLNSVVSTELVDTVDFQAGGFGSMFGKATGGIVSVNTRPGRTDRFGGAVDVNTLLAQAHVEGPIGKKGSFVAAARRSYFDLVLGPVVKGNTSEDDLKFSVFPQYYDYQVRADYHAITGSTLTAFVFGADDVLKMFFPRTNPRDPDATGGMFGHTLFHGQTIAYKQRSDAASSRTGFFHISTGQEMNIFGLQQNFRIETFGLTEDAAVPLGKRHTIHTGTQIQLSTWTADLYVPKPPPPGEKGVTLTDLEKIRYQRSIPSNSVGLFAEDHMKVTGSLSVVPGIRFDTYHQEKTYRYVDPRLQTRWEITNATALKGAVGRYSNVANPQQLDRRFGSPELQPIHAMHYVAGVEHKLSQADTFGVQAYYKQFENFPYQYSSGQAYRNTLKGAAYGAELSARHALTRRFFGWFSYAYARSFRKYPDLNAWARSQYDQPHVVNAVGSYKLTPRWELGAKWRFSSGNPYTPVSDRIYLADRSLYIPVEGERYSERLPNQHRLDARIEYTHPFETWVLRTYLEVLNVYAQENAAEYVDNYDYSSREPLTLLPFPVPMLGVRGEF